MTKFILFFFPILILLNACKYAAQDDSVGTYPTNFTPYIQNFEELFNMKVTSNIQFSPLLKGNPGRCLFEAKQIHINEKLWKDFSEETREALIIHELGHCELGLLDSDKEGSHIMSSFIGHNVLAYTTDLEAEIQYMLSTDHPKIIPH